MHRSQIKELHYITPIANLASILQHGILSNRRAGRLPHKSVAMEEIQQRRKAKPVPGGRRHLHDYVNLYFHARNPMMFRLASQHRSLCVLAVDALVLDLPNVMVTDQNAGSGYVRFYPSATGLVALDYGMIFAEDWTDADQIMYWRKKSAKCAEVLVPDAVSPRHLLGAHVSCQETAQAVHMESAGQLTTHANPGLFFQ